MIVQLNYKGTDYTTDLSKGLDISIPFEAGEGHVLAWYLGPMKIEPVRMGDWVGEVKSGAAVNFKNIMFNPHAHGTHTESPGHISPELISINKELNEFFCFAHLISITPEVVDGDQIITLKSLQSGLNELSDAIIIRTIPNLPGKLSTNYSNTNPPYLEAAAATWLRDNGVRHLLIDLPSVDKEEDGGMLLSHHAFWSYPDQPRLNATITEFIFVPDTIPDGFYFMNLQVAPFENDAAPSRPLLFELKKV